MEKSREQERKERRAIQVENGLIVLAILALWPAILRWPGRITWPVLILALAVMLVILARRWRRLLSLKKEHCLSSKDEAGRN